MDQGPPIRILHLIDSAEVAGGERYLLNLIRHSDPAFEHRVVLPYQGPLAKQLQELRCGYLPVRMEKKFSLGSIRKIRAHIRGERIRIVHTHGYRSNLYGRLAGWFAGVAHVATVHVSLYDYVDTPLPVRKLYLLVESTTSRLTSKFICISTAMKDDLLKMGIPEDKTVVIHNGVDLDVFHPREPDGRIAGELLVAGHRPIIGTVGRMVTEKGQVHLVEALPRLRDRWPTLRCLFIGKGPLLEHLKEKAEALGLAETCIFPGVRLDLPEVYPLMDLFVLPSLREPFGLVLLEAMASEVPVLATSAGGPLDFIESGVNGMLVPPASPRALAAQIEFLLSDMDQLREIAGRGYDAVVQKYGIKETVRKTEEVYRHSVKRS